MFNSNIYTLIRFLVACSLIMLAACTPSGEKSFTLGVLVPLTGDAANWGDESRRAVDLAVNEINESGGAGGMELLPIYQDSKASAREGVTAAQQLINVEGVRAIIGGITSAVTLAVAPLAEANEVLLISPTSSSPAVTDAGHYIFRNFPSNNLEGRAIAEYLLENGLEQVAIYQLQNDYGEGVSSTFSEVFTTGGGKVVLHELYPPDQSDFRSSLAGLKFSDADALYVVGYYTDAALLIKQARELGAEHPVFATTTVEDPRFLELGGDAVEGVIYPLASGYEESSSDPIVMDFRESYLAAYGEQPGFVAAQAYDCVYLLKEAIERGGSSGAELRTGMAGIDDFHGVTGLIDFDENGDISRRPVLKVVRDGAFVKLEDSAALRDAA